MAYRTATEPARLFGPAEFLARPELDRTPRRRDDPAPAFAPLATIWVCFAFLAGLSGAFKAGREVEKGSQFGRILALSQELDVLEAAAARSDSTVKLLAQLGARPRPPKTGARMPQVETSGFQPPRIPLLQVTP